MAITAGRPFTFETSFDSPHAAAAATHADEKRALRYSDEDLAKVRAEAAAEGHAAGRAAALQEREQRLAESLQRLGQGLKGLGEAQAASNAAKQRDALRLTALLVRKIAPHLIDQEAVARIEALMREILPKIAEEPRIVIRLADELIDMMKDRIDAIARGGAFEGRIVLLGQPGMRAGDCLIEWADGGVETRSEAFLAEIDAAVSRFLAALAPTPGAEATLPSAGAETP